ncbi:hypothetical protein C453_06913 [Haloferax elongans ATCC BAA-1513]|uniref:eCIS core domain-containing protein n=1 Tax=Haloferax elongans ATCC BAA-1513 TaxID=1230453 RepID=M0HM32_HALEO|nr:DUF4157 domain-containing protein [Haloferax elongans]ELZ85526.1 hypothetical protein C453_06913 [Haloferax elongans ATCC BAA-1513]
MGFRSAKEKTSEGQQSSTVPSIQELTGGSDRSRGGGESLPAQDSEAGFGLEAYRPGMDVQVQRLVESHGASQVRQWADEGMTVDTMGKPRDMRQFRERQKERPAEVPKDIERRNAKSVQRSRNAHHEASKAGDSQVPDSVRDVISSPGQQLDSSIQQTIEERMGDSLGDVRIHTGPQAAKACQDINARAFTVGNHIAFNHGEYDPNSAEGQHVLAHELAHVRQQTGGAVSMLPQEGLELEIDPDPQLEREAEETAQRVMRGGELGVHRMRHSEVHVQRMPSKSGRDDVSSLSALREMGVSEELIGQIRQEVDPNDHTVFIRDIKLIVDESTKDVGSDQGEVGEILSSEKGLSKRLAEKQMTETSDIENLTTIPMPNTFTKGVDIQCPNGENPEYDKVLLNEETGEVSHVVEEKTGGGISSKADRAILQAEDNLRTIQEEGINQILNDKWMDDALISGLSKEDFENASACAIVPKGMDNSETADNISEDQIMEYRWNPVEFNLMYKVVNEVK